MTGTSSIEWRYDATSSRPLRLLAHGFVAGLGGPLVLVGGIVLLALPEFLPRLDVRALLLPALLVLIGGPLSLIYLWPMLTDADQRPDIGVFAGAEGTSPWTIRSAAVATAAGAILLWGLASVGASNDALYGVVVALVFSPVVGNAFTTVGSLEAGRLVCNGTTVPLAQVTGVRSIRVGNAVICWVSYARGTGIGVPRLLTVPAGVADDVLATLETGAERRPDSPNTDRAVRAVLGASGLLFVGIAIVAARAADDAVVGAYLGGVLGLIGVLLWVAGWRGV